MVSLPNPSREKDLANEESVIKLILLALSFDYAQAFGSEAQARRDGEPVEPKAEALLFFI